MNLFTNPIKDSFSTFVFPRARNNGMSSKQTKLNAGTHNRMFSHSKLQIINIATFQNKNEFFKFSFQRFKRLLFYDRCVGFRFFWCCSNFMEPIKRQSIYQQRFVFDIQNSRQFKPRVNCWAGVHFKSQFWFTKRFQKFRIKKKTLWQILNFWF